MHLRNMNKYTTAVFSLMGAMLVSGAVFAKGPPGLNADALAELEQAGLNKYLGEFSPVSSTPVENNWVKHQFDQDAGQGPVCIAGSEYSAFTRQGNPAKLLILLQGGGACWDGLLDQCNIFAEAQDPRFFQNGIWDTGREDNPFADYSVVYLPYCDGSVFIGDNVVENDPLYGTRQHRGLRNLSAGMDLARQTFPNASRITVAGTSAGGVGAAAFAPFLTRFLYGNKVRQLTVLNDAGPIVGNPDAVDAAKARANDWKFEQFYPASCTDCDPLGQQTALIHWRLENDSAVREVFYGTDGDATDIRFTSANVPGFPPVIPFDPANGVFGLSQAQYRDLIETEHGALEAAFPNRYKRFIVSGDASHTALQSPLFYSQQVDGVVLNDWTGHFVSPRKPFWLDLVEDFIPLP